MPKNVQNDFKNTTLSQIFTNWALISSLGYVLFRIFQYLRIFLKNQPQHYKKLINNIRKQKA